MKLPVDLTKNEIGGDLPMLKREGGPRGPTVHICGKEELDFPDEGEMTVKFRVLRREEETQHEHYTEVLELTEIVKVKSMKVEAPAHSLDESGDAMDKLRAEMETEDEE